MKNVLHVIETGGPGGAETVFMELATGLDPARFRSVCAVPYEGWLSGSLRSRGVEPLLLPSRRGAIDVPLLAGLARIARRERIDLIQSHLFGMSFYSNVAGRALGIPVVSTFHGTVDIGKRGAAAALKMQAIARGSRRMVFVSESLRRTLLTSVRVPERRTAVIHNGVDTEVFAPRRSPALRAELGLGPEALIVGAIGNVRSAKGYDALVRVAAACADDARVAFVVIGEESAALMGELRALAAALGVEQRVRFLGFRNDIPVAINGLDIYLSTSRSEGFSLTTVQAMACAVPVIATRSGGPEEIVTDGVEGLLCAVDDVAAIAGAIRSLAVDEARRARLGKAGRRTAVERFALRRMVDGYAALYDAAMG